MTDHELTNPPIIRHANHETQWRYMVDEISKITGVPCVNPPEAIDAVRELKATLERMTSPPPQPNSPPEDEGDPHHG
jgi:hypothetical protein